MSDKIAVHLPAQESRDILHRYCVANNMSWFKYASWAKYGKDTAAEISYISPCIGTIAWFEDAGYHIISLEEALKEEPEQANVQKMHNAPEFVRGEEVEVWDVDSFAPDISRYVCTIDHEYPYVVEGLPGIGPACYKHIRKLPQVQEGTKKFTNEYINKFVDKNFEDDDVPAACHSVRFFLRIHGMLEE